MKDYEKIAEVIHYIEANYQNQPTLSEIADEVGLSEFHFHRLFSHWAGITPKEFLQHVTSDHAFRLLKDGGSVLDSSYEVGLSGPARLHDLCLKIDSATPGEIKSSGVDMSIKYGCFSSPFGSCLIAECIRGLCFLGFETSSNDYSCEDDLKSRWRHSSFIRDDCWANEYGRSIFETPENYSEEQPLKVFLKATKFQLQVWRALLRIPPGELSTYGRIAHSLNNRNASRAVGTAVGKNPVSYLIPCHRVIRESGAMGGYHWGITRKKAMLAYEQSGNGIQIKPL